MAEVLEGIRPMPYTHRRRAAFDGFVLAIIALVGMSLASAFLFSSAGFSLGAFSAGLVVGLFGAILSTIEINGKARKGETIQGAVLIRGRRRWLASFILTEAFVMILYVAGWLIGQGIIYSFLFGVISSMPFALLIGILLLETKFGKIYGVY